MRVFWSVLLLAGVFFVTSSAFGDGSYLEIGRVQKTRQTVQVCPVGNESQNGAALISAMDQIANFLPSESNRYLLKIEPGVYHLGGASLIMQPYVDIEGAGVETTLLKSSVNFPDGDLVPINASIYGADHAELRFLSFENLQEFQPYGNVIAFYNDDCSPTIYRVNFQCQTAPGFDVYGIYNSSGSPLISHLNIDVSTADTVYGVYNIHGGSPTLVDTNITGTNCSEFCYGIYNGSEVGNSRYDLERVKILLWSTSNPDIHQYGVYNEGATDGVPIQIKWSRIDAENSFENSRGIVNKTGTAYTINVFSSIISANTPVEGPGAFNCAFCADGGYGPLEPDCLYAQ